MGEGIAHRTGRHTKTETNDPEQIIVHKKGDETTWLTTRTKATREKLNTPQKRPPSPNPLAVMPTVLRRKRVPQRTCVGCRQIRPKRELVRVVRTPAAGVQIDETGKRSGRGAYLCRNRECWEVALSMQRLEHALKTDLNAEERLSLERFGQALAVPDDKLQSGTDVLTQDRPKPKR